MSGLNVKKHNNKTIKESGFLIRISENEYIESTRSGFLYMNPLSFFRKIEQNGVQLTSRKFCMVHYLLKSLFFGPDII